MSKVLWAHMKWPELQEALNEDPIVIVPVGAMEQHGAALPVWVDTADVEIIAHRAAEKLIGILCVLVTPAVWMGYSPHHMDYPGTISLDYETLSEVVYQICRSILHHGFRRILVLNGHGGNDAPLIWTIARLHHDFNIIVPRVTHWDLINKEPLSLEILEGRPAFGDHPGEYEHSLHWAIYPNLVSPNKIKSYSGKPKSQFIAGGQAAIYSPISVRSIQGAYGQNELASKEKGEKLLDFTIEKLAEFLVDFKKWDVEDISSMYSHDE